MMLRRLRTPTTRRGRLLLAGALVLGLAVTPLALAQTTLDGKPLLGGARNPSADQRQAFTKETEIIAQTNTYGTRQSNAAPLTTNAGGVATGFNADKVDGKDAAAIVGDAQAQNRFAAVSAAGALSAGRDAESAARTAAGTYTVTFKSDVSKCALGATETTIEDSGAASVAPASATTIQVRTRDAAGAAADRPFHLTVIC